MKKTFTKFLTGAVIFALLAQSTFASFSDVDSTNKNFTAINYLQENGVINGYFDGTFRPANAVNRAEFLKIIMEGSGIATNITSLTPFPDVNHDDWYGKYVIKAFHSNWINGYPDGTFHPEQTINKVEALKILGKVQKWQLQKNVAIQPFEDTPLGEWYLPYVTYAQQKSFLEETGGFFNPDARMTRASISEIIYRSRTLAPTNIATTVPIEEEILATDIQEKIELVPEEPETTVEPASDFAPESFALIETDFFEGIILDNPLPSIFYKNEVYRINGTLTDQNSTEATAVLEGTSNTSYENFGAKAASQHFEIIVHFEQPGNYIFGILPGDSGSTRAAAISVSSTLPDSANTGTTTAPSALDITYANDQTSVSFNTPASTFKKLTFNQNGKTVIYFFRQDTASIPVRYSNFQNFDTGIVTYFVESASLSSQQPLEISSPFTKSAEKTFQPLEHSFSDIDSKISALPPDTLDLGQSITFSGTAQTEIFEKAYAIKPDGLVEIVTLSSTSPKSSYLGSTTILSGGSFSYAYTPATEGRHILEINDKEGKPLLNHPVYIGSKIPLLPDFFDLNTRTLFEGDFDISTFRQTLLGLINKARADHGQRAVTMTEDLNGIAQGHSNDMRDRNFFGHVNPDGKTPDDRRLAAGIKTPVGENIAKDVSVEAGHYGLMRSASHRENILNPDWTHVGLGITEDQGYIIIAEEFSISELTQADLENFKSQLYAEITEKRQSLGLASLNTKTNAEGTAKYLNDKKINEGQDINSATFSEAIQANNLSGSSSATGLITNSWTSILDSIINEETNIRESQWLSIGADIQLDAAGNIHLIMVLNNQA